MLKAKIFMASGSSLLIASTAFGQTISNLESMGPSKTAETLTCADIITLDTEVLPGVLYYVAGYQQGNKSNNDSSTVGATQPLVGTGTASTGASDSTTSSTAANSSKTTEAGGSSSTAKFSDGAAEQTSTATEPVTHKEPGVTAEGIIKKNTGKTMNEADSDDRVQIANVAGLYNVPVEKILAACREEPQDKSSDVIKQNTKGTSSTSN